MVDLSKMQAQRGPEKSEPKEPNNQDEQERGVEPAEQCEKVRKNSSNTSRPPSRGSTTPYTARARSVRSTRTQGSPAWDEVAAVPDEVGVKRTREELPPMVGPRPPKGLAAPGVNHANGVESYWDDEDPGLAWEKGRPLLSSFDMDRFKTHDERTLLESVANNCFQTLNVAAYFERQVRFYQDRLARVKEDFRRASEESFQQKEQLQKEKEEHEKLMEELEMERAYGTSFLRSEAGRHFILALERQAAQKAIEDFKKGPECKELVMQRVTSVYDGAVKEGRRLLRESD